MLTEDAFTRTDDKIDADLIAKELRRETEPIARRPARYNTAFIAAFGWIYVDRYREWSRHRNKPPWMI